MWSGSEGGWGRASSGFADSGSSLCPCCDGGRGDRAHEGLLYKSTNSTTGVHPCDQSTSHRPALLQHDTAGGVSTYEWGGHRPSDHSARLKCGGLFWREEWRKVETLDDQINGRFGTAVSSRISTEEARGSVTFAACQHPRQVLDAGLLGKAAGSQGSSFLGPLIPRSWPLPKASSKLFLLSVRNNYGEET